MAPTRRKPLVLIGATRSELPSGDTLGINAFFTTAGTPLPTLTALGSTALVMAVTPTLAGDALAAGEVITVVPSAALPGGLNIAYAIASAINQVTIGFSAVVSVTASNRTWTVCAHR